MVHIDIDKIFSIIGGRGKYQITLLLCTCLIWLSVDYIAISFSLLMFYPDMFYLKNDENSWIQATEIDQWCEIRRKSIEKTKYTVYYNNILTDLDLYCNDLLIKMIMILFTLGIVIGAFLASKYADIIGRRMVTILFVFIFGVFASLMTLIHNHFVIGISLFFMGIGASGGTMCSFMLVYEEIDSQSRNFFGIFINASYAVAGALYFLIMYITKSWFYISALSLLNCLISIIWLIISFVESPRFLLSSKKYKNCLIALLRISYKNNKLQEYISILKDEIFNEEQIGSYNTAFSRKSQDEISYIEIKNFLNTCSFNKHKKKEYENSSSVEITTSEDDKVENEEKLIENETLQYVENDKDPGIKALCNYPSVRYTFIYCSILWVSISYCYFGQSFIQKEELKDTIFIKGWELFGAEFIGYIITGFIMEIKYMGRTRTIGYSGIGITITGIIMAFYQDHEVVGNIFIFIFRFFATAIFTGMYTYVTEVYPTCIRSKGMGLNITFARLTTIVVALTAKKEYAYIVFSVLGIVIFVVHFMLKETFGIELPEDIEERINKRNSFLNKQAKEGLSLNEKI